MPEALLVFGLCRAPSESWTAKLLTHPLFLGFVPYTFAAYIIHFPVLLFAQFVRIEGITSLKGLFRRVYRAQKLLRERLGLAGARRYRNRRR